MRIPSLHPPAPGAATAPCSSLRPSWHRPPARSTPRQTSAARAQGTRTGAYGCESALGFRVQVVAPGCLGLTDAAASSFPIARAPMVAGNSLPIKMLKLASPPAGWPLATSLLTSLVLPSAGFGPRLCQPARPGAAARALFSRGHSDPGPRVAVRRWAPARAPCPLRSMAVPVAGQDLSEMFDLYEAPEPTVAAFRGEPRATGRSKQRKLVHADGDWHRAVHVWLYTSAGQLVLQKRAEGKDTFPGRWDVSVGGHVTSGDSVEFTARKEVEEELGLKIHNDALEKIGVFATTATGSSPIGGEFTCNEYKDLFLLRFDGDVGELRFSPDEVADVALKHWTEVRQDLLAQLDPDDRELDGPMIQRPRHYIDALFAALGDRLPSHHDAA